MASLEFITNAAGVQSQYTATAVFQDLYGSTYQFIAICMEEVGILLTQPSDAPLLRDHFGTQLTGVDVITPSKLLNKNIA